MDILEGMIVGWIIFGFLNLGFFFKEFKDNSLGESLNMILGCFLLGPFLTGFILRSDGFRELFGG